MCLCQTSHRKHAWKFVISFFIRPTLLFKETSVIDFVILRHLLAPPPPPIWCNLWTVKWDCDKKIFWKLKPFFSTFFLQEANFDVFEVWLFPATRLESKVFSLEMLYPLSPVEDSMSQTNIGSGKLIQVRKKLWIRLNFGSTKILGQKTFGPTEIVSPIFFWK